MAERLLDDIAMWMGVPDEMLTVRSCEIKPELAMGTRPLLAVSASLDASDDCALEPVELGNAVLEEAREGRLVASVFVGAAAAAEGGVVIQNSSLAIPEREGAAACSLLLGSL